jgi:hypothetical protein
MKNLAILMVVITMASLADAEMTLKIVDNGDGTCGIWSSGFNSGNDMFFALTTEYPPYPSGGYVTDIAPPGTIISPSPIEAGIPLASGEDGVWGYIGDPMGNPAPGGKYIDGIQVTVGATVKLYKIAEDWNSVTLLDTHTLRDSDCLIGGIAHANEYANWVAWGKPDCWCYARQCRGDINGRKTGPYWVQLLDLQLFAQGYLKSDVNLDKIPGGICGDINHTKTGPYRINLSDLFELAQYYLKPEAQVPMCDQAPLKTGPYNYFVEP